MHQSKALSQGTGLDPFIRSESARDRMHISISTCTARAGKSEEGRPAVQYIGRHATHRYER